jgi:DNA-binding MarR family transcriptional regulator
MVETSSPLVKPLTDEVMWKICRIHELFRTKDVEVPGQLVSVFCYIASHNPCNLQSIEKELGLSPNSTSRNTDWLSTHHRLGKPGMGLIYKKRDPFNGRRRIVELTDKGYEMIEQIKEILNDH